VNGRIAEAIKHLVVHYTVEGRAVLTHTFPRITITKMIENENFNSSK
jgi:hypothetical protein